MTPEQDQALRDYLRESIIPLIEQVLVKKLGQAMTFAAEELIQPKRQWVGLTDDERVAVQYEAHKKGLTPLEFMELHEAKLREKNGGHI